MPRILITDPPYGVAYDPTWRHALRPAQRTAIGSVPNDHQASWRRAWNLFRGPIAYIWYAALRAQEVMADVEAAGFQIRSQIVWAKQHFVLGRGDYAWGHEPALYCVRRGATSHWRGDRSQSTLWEVPNLNAMGGTRTGDNVPTGHATQKPVRLWEIPIGNHTTASDVVYDPFCGSGTALIAAEKAGRTCVALEINPRYANAAAMRWAAFTGQRAIRQAPGSRAAGRRRT